MSANMQINPVRGVEMLRRWHRGERGAVAMAALAACILLLMMGATLWDTGNTVRAKTKLQTATDSAAYTQAAIKARTMNFVSFANIGKRTVTGVHNSYWAWAMAWDSMTAARCAQMAACCAPTPLPKPCCTPCVIRDCLKNWSFYAREGPDYQAFSGSTLAVPGIESVKFLLGTSLNGNSKHGFGRELAALNRFQEYLSGVTPWWGFLASALRGAKNGATATTSWPLPPMEESSEFSVTYQHIKRFLNAIGDAAEWLSDGSSPIPDFELPVIADNVPVSQSSSKREACHFPVNISVGGFSLGSTGPGTIGRGAEFLGNHAINYARSTGESWNACAIRPETVMAAATTLYNLAACSHSTTVNNKFEQNMAPMKLDTGMTTEPSSELGRTNLVIGYRHLDYVSGTKYAFNPEYESSNTWSSLPYPGLENVNHYEPNGVWSIARSEVTTPEKYSINTGPVDDMITSDGTNGPWMFTTGWTARIRPLQYDGEFGGITEKWLEENPYFEPTEFATGDVNPNAIFTDIGPVMLLQAQALNQLNGLDASDVSEVFEDFEYMWMKGANSMDNETLHAVPK